MSKVVIITREIAYKSGIAFNKIKEIKEEEEKEKSKTSNPAVGNISAGKGKIHDYVYKILESVFKDENKDRFYKLTTSELSATKASMDALRAIAATETQESNEQDNVANKKNVVMTPEISDTDYKRKTNTLFKKCDPIVENILGIEKNNESSKDHRLKGDCNVKPYVCFKHKNATEEVEVCFVFLNRIFDLFVASYDDYPQFMKGDPKKRLEFIKAICEDCDVKKGEGNILYIHDKEWYESGREDCVLYKGKWDSKYENESYANELGEYFHTIQVFMHNSTTFERIKKLNFIFPEKDAEEAIIRRSFF